MYLSLHENPLNNNSYSTHGFIIGWYVRSQRWPLKWNFKIDSESIFTLTINAVLLTMNKQRFFGTSRSSYRASSHAFYLSLVHAHVEWAHWETLRLELWVHVSFCPHYKLHFVTHFPSDVPNQWQYCQWTQRICPRPLISQKLLVYNAHCVVQKTAGLYLLLKDIRRRCRTAKLFLWRLQTVGKSVNQIEFPRFSIDMTT